MATQPRILIDVNNAGTHYRWSTEDLYLSGVYYQRRIPDDVSVKEELTEQLYGYTSHNDIKIPLLNDDGALSTIWQGDSDRRQQISTM